MEYFCLGSENDMEVDNQINELVLKKESIQQRISQLKLEIANLEKADKSAIKQDFELDLDLEEFEAPEWCVPIKANVLNFEFDKLAEECQFDVIVMDPPWQLATHAPTRGVYDFDLKVAIAYQQLPDMLIEELPIKKLQANGLIFIWTINNKYIKSLELLEMWGYEFIDEIHWVKKTCNRRMCKGHGYYLQHAKETCLVGVKGNLQNVIYNAGSNVIYSERRGQSQKPVELYELIERIVPNGKYLEIFGRKNNLRDYWVTIGNEL